MQYEIYYRKELANCSKLPVNLSCEDYEHIGTVDEARDLEEVFEQMNLVLPDRFKCRSMSIGDVAIDMNGDTYMCMPSGWDKVNWRS